MKLLNNLRGCLIVVFLLFLFFYRNCAAGEMDKTVELLQKGNDREREYAAEFLGKLNTKTAIPYLKEAVEKDSSFLVRLGSVSSLNKLGEPVDEELIEKALQNDDKYVRLKAAHILQGLSSWKNKEIILNLFNDKDVEVRKNIIIAAGKLGIKEALDSLIIMLKDPISDNRESAVIALGSLGDRRALKPLLEILDDPVSKVVRVAVISLGEIGDEEINMPMIRMLGHKDKSVRYYATSILGKLGEKSGFKAILGVIKDKESRIRLEAVTVLGELRNKEYIPVFKEVLSQDTDPYVKLQAARNLILLGDYTGYDLIKNEVFNKNSDLKKMAIETLGMIKDVKSISIVNDSYIYPNPEIKEIVIWALGEIRGANTFGFLLKKLKEEKEFKIVIIDALRKFQDKRLIPYLENFLDDENFLIRKRAAGVLGDFSDVNPETEKKIIHLLSDEYSEVRQSALYTLVRWHKKIDLELLNIAKNNSDPLQMMAIAGLIELNNKEVLPVIYSLYEGKMDLRYKLLLASQLASFGDYRGKGLIMEMAKSEDYVLRKQAAEYLSKFIDADIFPILSNLINDKRKEVRLAAARTLGQIFDQRAVSVLINNLVSENLYLEREIDSSLLQLQDISMDYLININKDKNFTVKGNMAYIERAGSVLCKIGLPSIDKLIKAYGSEDMNMKFYVMNILTKIGKDSLKPMINYWDGKFVQSNTILVDSIMKISIEDPKVLVDLLNDELLQNKAVVLIARINPDKTLDLLISKLYESSGMLRIKVTECLRRMGSVTVDRLVGDLFKSEDSRKLLIIEVLGEIGEEKVVPYLEKIAVETNNTEVKESALKVIAGLKSMLMTSGSDKSQIDKLKKKRGKISMVEKNYIFTDLGWQDGINIGMVFQVIDKNNSIVNKLQISEVVGNNVSIGKLFNDTKVEAGYIVEEEVKESEAKGAGLDDIKIQLGRIKDKQPQIRDNAINILGEKGDESVLPEIISVLEEKDIVQEGQINIRKSAVWAIGEIEYRSISKIYQDSGEKKILSDEKKELLNKITNILINSFSDLDSGVRLAAVRNIMRLISLRDAFGLKNDFVLDPVCKLLSDSDNYTQRAAVEALAELKDPKSVPFLVSVWDDDDATVRGNVVWALEKIGKPAVPSLKEALNDKNDEKKRAAASVLYKLGYKVKRTGNIYEVLE